MSKEKPSLSASTTFCHFETAQERVHITPNNDNTTSTDTDTWDENPSPARQPIDYHRIVCDNPP